MEDRFCACGCGEPVLATRSDACYASKACKDRYWRATNRDKNLEYNHHYYADNREKILEDKRRWYAANREEKCEYNRRQRATEEYRKKYNKWKSEYKRRLRLEVYDKLGGKCAWPGCGITDERLLAIDHRNGDGAIERRSLNRNQISLYKKVLKDPAPYQLLCHNHNILKAIENGEMGRRNHRPSYLPAVNLNEERKAS